MTKIDVEKAGGQKQEEVTTMVKGDMRGSYCVYSWKDDGSDTRLESKHEFKADAFAAADKWNEENKGSGRTAGIGWIRSDGQIDGYIGA